MTDLTPAQLVEKLREYSDSDDHPINLAAALIEQQAEQIAALRKVIEEASAALATEVIPFGDSMWRTWDKKILATRAVLEKALPNKETP